MIFTKFESFKIKRWDRMNDKYQQAKQFFFDLKRSKKKVIAADAVTHHMASLITRVAELERSQR